MKGDIQIWEGDLAVRIPSTLAAQIGLGEHTRVEIRVQYGELIISPLGDVAPTLEQLLEGITAENRHSEITTGSPVGNELW